MSTFIVTQLVELEAVAYSIIALTKQHSVFCLYGNLGAGKTTLVKLICEQLQVKDTITSPTYPIINEYSSPNGLIYHIDLYRLKSAEEAINIGLEEYLFSGNLCFIEWPDNFETLLPDHPIKIFIRKLEGESRVIEIQQTA
ncbi:MAG TPA: tRNA (adenosine(37)-N6)-threonylcarbamoyltransferase complex ATPase subunit type 1 TsaE [Chitinophagales bacterium]|jgi:tRNA threonylcarbamoyladenosine biosynthesis protein TsaE|nr:tRNA (adenosine(37)-N6)-threonylcarbamoyltransferase complex ATPase subunit type 1 TsaE [Chitinophagales bacterium]